MFVARAGLRTLNTDGSHPFAYRPRKKKDKEKFRCYLPFMWPTCGAVLLGTIIVAAGVLMCVVGYFSGEGSTSEGRSNTNDTAAWNTTTESKNSPLRALTFIGPVFMGFGCFVIVVACVVVCETRDKMLKLIAQAEKQKTKMTTKPDFYDLVIKQFKNKHRATLRRSSRVSHRSIGDAGDRGGGEQRRCSLFRQLRRPHSAKTPYSHIGGALKNIPVQIFTIDTESTRKSSVQPIAVRTERESGIRTLRQDSAGCAKYPSASCIHDLLKDPNRKVPRTIKPLPAELSWVTRPKTVFRDRRPMHRLTPLPRSDALYQPEATCSTTQKDTGAQPKQVTRESSSDSDREDVSPGGCLCRPGVLSDKDYLVTSTSDLNEDGSVSASYAAGPENSGPTLLLHKASIHGEDYLARPVEHLESDTGSIVSLSSASSMSLGLEESVLNGHGKGSSSDSLLLESGCSEQYDDLNCDSSVFAAAVSNAKGATVSTMVVPSTSCSSDDNGDRNGDDDGDCHDNDGDDSGESVVKVPASVSTTGLADSANGTAIHPAGTTCTSSSSENTAKADSKPNYTSGTSRRQRIPSLVRESPCDLRRSLGPPSSTVPHAKGTTDVQGGTKLSFPVQSENSIRQVAV